LKITIFTIDDITYTQTLYSKESGLSFTGPHISTILFMTVYCVNTGNHKTDVIHLSNQNYTNAADTQLSMVTEGRMTMYNSTNWTIYYSIHIHPQPLYMYTALVFIASIGCYLMLKLTVNVVLEAARKKLHTIQFQYSTV
jgi:hypothetical protein